jgi:nucleotide-binding universal stress UspA family protein
MTEFKDAIIVGYDGSGCADRALEWAVEEARLRQVTLTIFHSWNFPYTGMMGPVSTQIEEAAEQTLQTAVDRVRAAAPDVVIKPLLSYGPPALVLVDSSKQADLVVVGSHGHSDFRELMLGSVSAQVAQHAACPVVVVRGSGELAPEDYPGRIVVGTDGSVMADHAVGLAFEEAYLRGLPLMAVCAWHLPDHAAPHAPYLDAGGLRKVAKEQFQDALAIWGEKYPDVRVLAEFTDEPAAEALIAASAGARLVVVGSRGLGAVRGRLLGSVSQHLLHHAPCPVEVVRS